MREGEMRRIPAREVVPGDLLLSGEGERIAADGWIVRAEDLSVDESLLTGESVPVSKRARTAQDGAQIPAPGGDDQPYAYAGSLLVRGHAQIVVAQTGVRTAAGQIGVSLATISSEQTLLQRSIGRLVRWFGLVALLVSVTVVLGYGLIRGDWVQGLLSSIALAMAMLPEEFPMALAVFLALGAWRMAKVKVLVRRPANGTGYRVSAIHGTEKTPLWETDLSVPAGQICVDPATSTISSVSSHGALYKIDRQALTEGYANPAADLGSLTVMSYTDGVELGGGKWALVDPNNLSRVAFYDTTQSTRPLRAVSTNLPEGKATAGAVALRSAPDMRALFRVSCGVWAGWASSPLRTAATSC